MDVRELAPGLWWWSSSEDAPAGSLYWEGEDAVCLVDPAVPPEPEEAERFWRHLDHDVARMRLPVVVLLTAPQHGRDTLEFVRRYDAAVHGPSRGLDALPAGVELVARGPGHAAYRIPSSSPVVVGRVDA